LFQAVMLLQLKLSRLIEVSSCAIDKLILSHIREQGPRPRAW